MAQEIIKGNKIQCFYQGNTFAYATSHTLTITGNTSDITSKDHGEWGATDVTSLSWEVTGEYFYTDTDYDTLFDLMLYKRPVLITVAEVRNYDENGLSDLGGSVYSWSPSVVNRSGYAVITSLTANANTGEKATYSITFTGNGPLSIVDNTTTDYEMYVTYKSENLDEGMDLFDMRASGAINSCWVYSGNNVSHAVQLDISDGKLHGTWPDEDFVFVFYIGGPSVPEYMFYQNNNVDTVYINANFGNIQAYAFSDSSITSFVTDTDNYIDYGHHCFANCNFLEKINYSNVASKNYLKARHISNSAFSSCTRLNNVVTGDTCDYILNYAFSECMSLSTVWFGSELRQVGDNAFTTSSHVIPKDFHFYTETAPNIGTLPFGPSGMQVFYLHNNTSVQEFIGSNGTWRQYADADFRLES